MLRSRDHSSVSHAAEGQYQMIVGQFAAPPASGHVDHPALQVDALNRGLDEPGGPQEGTNGEAAVSCVKSSGANLKQQRRHDEKVVAAHQSDFDIRAAPAKLLQVSRGVDPTEAATEDQDPSFRRI